MTKIRSDPEYQGDILKLSKTIYFQPFQFSCDQEGHCSGLLDRLVRLGLGVTLLFGASPNLLMDWDYEIHCHTKYSYSFRTIYVI